MKETLANSAQFAADYAIAVRDPNLVVKLWVSHLHARHPTHVQCLLIEGLRCSLTPAGSQLRRFGFAFRTDCIAPCLEDGGNDMSTGVLWIRQRGEIAVNIRDDRQAITAETREYVIRGVFREFLCEKSLDMPTILACYELLALMWTTQLVSKSEVEQLLPIRLDKLHPNWRAGISNQPRAKKASSSFDSSDDDGSPTASVSDEVAMMQALVQRSFPTVVVPALSP